MTETQQHFRRINRERRIRVTLAAAEAARKLCVCTHTKARHMFGRQCDMPRCRCKSFEAA
jgi:hypothetical protein